MAFWGNVGKALKAPIKPINKAVGKIPGMKAVGGAMNKISPPGMNKLGIGPTPNPNAGQMGKLASAGAGLGNMMNPNRNAPAVQPSPQMDASQAPPPDFQPQTSGGFASPEAIAQSRQRFQDSGFNPVGKPPGAYGREVIQPQMEAMMGQGGDGNMGSLRQMLQQMPQFGQQTGGGMIPQMNNWKQKMLNKGQQMLQQRGLGPQMGRQQQMM